MDKLYRKLYIISYQLLKIHENSLSDFETPLQVNHMETLKLILANDFFKVLSISNTYFDYGLAGLIWFDMSY